MKQSQNQIIFEAVRTAAKIENLTKILEQLDTLSDELYSFNNMLSREIEQKTETIKEEIYELIHRETKMLRTEIFSNVR